MIKQALAPSCMHAAEAPVELPIYICMIVTSDNLPIWIMKYRADRSQEWSHTEACIRADVWWGRSSSGSSGLKHRKVLGNIRFPKLPRSLLGGLFFFLLFNQTMSMWRGSFFCFFYHTSLLVWDSYSLGMGPRQGLSELRLEWLETANDKSLEIYQDRIYEDSRVCKVLLCNRGV